VKVIGNLVTLAPAGGVLEKGVWSHDSLEWWPEQFGCPV
jgi:hypothetical protein